MKFKIFILIFLFSSIYIYSQSGINKDSIAKGKWKVEKEYDNDGNLIAYDSIYVWSGSNLKDFSFYLPEMDSLGMPLIQSFKDFRLPDWDFKKDFNNFFGENSKDSLLNGNIFEKYFHSHEFNFKNEFESLKQKLDSLQQDFNNFYRSEINNQKKENSNKL